MPRGARIDREGVLHSPMAINTTHAAHLKSWVESANDPASDFPIQNLPLCAFEGEHGQVLGTRIGDMVVDLSMLSEAGVITHDHDGHDCHVLQHPIANSFLAHGPALWSEVRAKLQEFLSAGGGGGGQQARRLRDRAVRKASEVRFGVPMVVENYSDFYASIDHASTVGAMFRPDNPLLPNYKHVPIGYHGRASSIVPSGTPIPRPKGQQSPPENDPKAGPTFGPCKLLDYELELGAVVGEGNDLGQPIPIGEARRHLFGVCLVNDWSARDIQKWEYQPLGPFLAKNFATSVGDCIVSMEALEPFRAPAFERPAGDPAPLDYLRDVEDQRSGGLEVTLEVWLKSAEMEKRGMSAVRVSRGSFRRMYWTLQQMLAHHTSNGCNVRPGDILASGTVSGPGKDERGCLLELTWDGTDDAGKPRPRRPITLPTGETRTFLGDGDTVILRGSCEKEGYRRIGLGECSGTILTAR
jgi:fumarylacetoacetase